MHGLSIKTKNIIIILSVVLFAIVTTIVIQGINDIKIFRNHLVNKIESVAEAVSVHSAVPIQFNDKNLADKTIASLEAIPEVADFAIYDLEKKAFIPFKDKTNTFAQTIKQLTTNAEYIDDYLYVRKEIVWDEESYGHVYVVASTNTGPTTFQFRPMGF